MSVLLADKRRAAREALGQAAARRRQAVERAEYNTQPPSTFAAPGAWLLEAMAGGRTATGITVTPQRAAQSAVIQACAAVLRRGIASLPLHIYRQRDQGATLDRSHAAFDLLYRRPNPRQTAAEFRDVMMQAAIYRGQGLARIERDSRGRALALWPLHPDRVRILRQPISGRAIYEYHDRDGLLWRLSLEAGDVLRVPWIPLDEYYATTPIDYARETLALNLASTEYRALFSNSAMPSLILSTPNVLTQDGLERMQRAWGERYAGLANAHKPAILEQGTTATPITMTAEAGQFLEQMKYTRTELCGLMGVEPTLIGDYERATYSNVEQANISHVVHCLRPWCTVWEQAIQAWLLIEEPEVFARFELDALLRGDALSRADAHGKNIQYGIRSPNECRALENLNPIAGGDTYYYPANLLPLGSRPAETPPAGPPPPAEPEEVPA